MRDMPEQEARSLLEVGSKCPGAVPWVPSRSAGLQWSAGAGLVDGQGSPRGLYVELVARQVLKPNMRAYRFSVYRTLPQGPQRVYQLDVPQWPNLPRDQHHWPHEHIGNRRIAGDEGWVRWSLADAIDRFCAATNTKFEPEIPDPFEFRLQG